MKVVLWPPRRSADDLEHFLRFVTVASLGRYNMSQGWYNSSLTSILYEKRHDRKMQDKGETAFAKVEYFNCLTHWPACFGRSNNNRLKNKRSFQIQCMQQIWWWWWLIFCSVGKLSVGGELLLWLLAKSNVVRVYDCSPLVTRQLWAKNDATSI